MIFKNILASYDNSKNSLNVFKVVMDIAQKYVGDLKKW